MPFSTTQINITPELRELIQQQLGDDLRTTDQFFVVTVESVSDSGAERVEQATAAPGELR